MTSMHFDNFLQLPENDFTKAFLKEQEPKPLALIK